MKRRKIIPGPALMVISILFLTAFQLYWLKQNYAREKKTLNIKAEVSFRETINRLQVYKLKLDGVNMDSLGMKKMKMFVADDGGGKRRINYSPRREMISTINIMRDKLKRDSMMPKTKGRMIVAMDNNTVSVQNDSIRIVQHGTGRGNDRDLVFNFLYGVDSLQDSIRINEIHVAYSKAMKEQKLSVPFDVIRLDSADNSDEPVFNEVTVGFAKPITYRLELGNTFPYLVKQITQPILFSILLLGITILSFVLLYRNLLRQQRLSEQKNEFISNITHELKTPIATVGVAIEALRNFNAIQDPQRTKEYLDISQNELQRLGLLVDKVLKLSMFEKKEVELKYETVNLKAIVTEVVDSLKLQLEKYRAKLTVNTEGDLSIQGDQLHLLSVMFNLIDNALKYSKSDPVIQIDIKEIENAVRLTITDNGIGIAPEYKDRVFEKFFRIPHGDTHNAKGYGLGLSYVAQVIQKHKGTIVVEGQPNGTQFIITLPKTPTA